MRSLLPELSARYGLLRTDIYGLPGQHPGLTVYELARYVDHLQQRAAAEQQPDEGSA